MKSSSLVCALVALLGVSCAESAGTVSVDAEWNLTCPDGNAAGCASLSPDTCLRENEDGVVAPGWRSIVGARGDISCTGDPIIVSCQAIDRPDGLRIVDLEANIDDKFAFELSGATVDTAGSMQETACKVTIIEDGVFYDAALSDVGNCGEEPPSTEQPCQLSNISTGDGEVVFDLECKALANSTTGLGFDVGAVGGGPTTIRFTNCDGF